MRRWEDVRARGWLTAERKAALRSPTQAHHLYVNADGDYELHEIEMLPTPARAKDVRAFLFERNGRRVVAHWHVSGTGTLTVGLGPAGEPVTVRTEGVRYLETERTREEVRLAWQLAEER